MTFIAYEYPKTTNLLPRDPETHKILSTPKPDFAQIATWLVTEKIDGTNIRLVFDALDREQRRPVLRGRSDNANLPPDFFEEAFPQFEDERHMRDSLALALGLVQKPSEGATFSCILFGEGYGPGIQKGGGRYAQEKRFRAFDLATFKTTYVGSGLFAGGTGSMVAHTTGPLWRRWEDMETVAQAMGVETVPVVSWFQRMDTNEVIRYVRGDADSLTARADGGPTEPPDGAHREQEGVVARTDPYLYDSRGDRIMFKLKQKDPPLSALDDLKLTRVENTAQVEELMRWLGERRATKLSIDIETTGLNAGSDKIRTCQFGDAQQGWFLDYRDWRGVAKQVIETYDRPMVAHNLLFEQKMLKADGIEDPQKLAHDTMVMVHLKNPTLGMDLKGSAARYVDKRARIGQNLLKEAYQQTGTNWATIPTDVPAYWIYSTMDTCLCSMLDEVLYDDIMARYREAYELELAVIHVLRDAELAGMLVDEDYRQKAQMKLELEIALLEPQIPIDNPGSDQKLIHYLHSLGAHWEIYTEKGNLSVDKHVLKMLSAQFPVCSVISEWRQKTHLLRNYILKMAEVGTERGLAYQGVLRCNTRTVEARTGRMSVMDPPMQTLPRGRVVRDAIIARPEHAFVMADFAGMEMRALASMAQEQRMLAMFNAGDDVHSATARALYGDNFTKQQRTVCKNGGFAKVYGAGIEKFAATAEISTDQARAFTENYNLLFPGIAHFMEATTQEVMGHAGGKRGYGWVFTIDGRKLLVEGDKAYKGVNFKIQGSCAVTLKQKIVELSQAGLHDWFRLPVHDELILEVPFEHCGNAQRVVEHIMPDKRNFPGVTLEIESDMVDRWGQHYRGDFDPYIETEDPSMAGIVEAVVARLQPGDIVMVELESYSDDEIQQVGEAFAHALEHTGLAEAVSILFHDGGIKLEVVRADPAAQLKALLAELELMANSSITGNVGFLPALRRTIEKLEP